MFRQKKTRIKLFSILDLPVLSYGSENWTIKARDPRRRKTAAEIKYTRKTAGCSWTDSTTNKDTANELNMTPILDKIQEYRRHWLQNVNRMQCNRLARILKNNRPKGRRSQRRPIKKLLDVCDQNGSTSGPTPC